MHFFCTVPSNKSSDFRHSNWVRLSSPPTDPFRFQQPKALDTLSIDPIPGIPEEYKKNIIMCCSTSILHTFIGSCSQLVYPTRRSRVCVLRLLRGNFTQKGQRAAGVLWRSTSSACRRWGTWKICIIYWSLDVYGFSRLFKLRVTSHGMLLGSCPYKAGVFLPHPADFQAADIKTWYDVEWELLAGVLWSGKYRRQCWLAPQCRIWLFSENVSDQAVRHVPGNWGHENKMR